LLEANLNRAILDGTNLSRANLNMANLNMANLNMADLSLAYVERTVFGNLDLRTVKGLETLIHVGPSTIGIDTIIRPQGGIPEVFLCGAGISDTFIAYLPSFLTTAIQYYSLFISYANPDETVAHRLYQDLQKQGVRCWMAPHDLRPGDYHPSR